ncbi:hypothetical protein Acr_08g0018320 [Actinidia rufa]|uniref:Uncharacterized protein n=1 Tax=Actinidia rufa TaxID=165716 RepID=A0A7J0F4W1_9ERIC|nr:hypothetical protein Acr_08g0018320 [Actinidia rufa]
MSFQQQFDNTELQKSPPKSCQVEEAEEEQVVDELLLILVQCLERVSTKSRQLLLKKFFGEVEKEMSSEGFIPERIGSSQALKIENLDEMRYPIISTQRGIGFDDNSSQKLERFKIRTPVLDGVIVEEETKGNSGTKWS